MEKIDGAREIADKGTDGVREIADRRNHGATSNRPQDDVFGIIARKRTNSDDISFKPRLELTGNIIFIFPQIIATIDVASSSPLKRLRDIEPCIGIRESNRKRERRETKEQLVADIEPAFFPVLLSFLRPVPFYSF